MDYFFGTISVLFRLIAYSYLRWIPGRQATFSVPILFIISNFPLIYQVFSTRTSLPPPSTTLSIKPINANSIVSLDPSTDSDTENRSGRRGEVGTIRRKKGSGSSTPTTITADALVEAPEAVAIDKVGTLPTISTRVTNWQAIKSLLIGSTSTSTSINLISLSFNLLILACVLDSIFTPIFSVDVHDLAFTRVGGLSSSSAIVFARIPRRVESVAVEGESLMELEKEEFSGARVEYRPSMPIGKWIKGGNLVVDEKKDWTGVLKLDNLYASTEYEYRLLLPSLLHSHHPSFHLQKFTTFPDPSLSLPHTPGSAGTHYTFASSSCIKPNFPYAGPFSHLSIPGLQYLSDEIERRKEGSGLGGGTIRFLLFLGDFIYADTPYLPETGVREQYLKRYRQTFASEDMKRIVEKIPLISIYDDHEILNDFSTNSTDPHFAPANAAFVNYLGSVNPSSPPTSTSTSSSKSSEEESINYFNFQHGDSTFFVFDTRQYRSPNELEDTIESGKTMLGLKQKEAFLDWCRSVNQTVTWKFVVSSTPMMTLWSHGSDTWAGFQTEREELLDVLEYMPNVIVLSGDRHEFAAASLRNGKVTEFSTSPLSQFYLPIRTLSQSNGRGATGEDILLKYLPDGNSKFSTFEVDTRISNKPIVRVKVIIDGEEAWKVDVLGRALDLPKVEKGLGGLGLSLLELLGFKKRSWF